MSERRQRPSGTAGGARTRHREHAGWDLRDSLAVAALERSPAEAAALEEQWRAALAGVSPAERPARLRDLLTTAGVPVGATATRRRLRELAHQAAATRLPAVWREIPGREDGPQGVPRLEMRLLGELTVEGVVGATRVRPRWRGRQPWLALAALAISGPRALARRTLVAVLWPDGNGETDGHQLAPVLSHLRQALRQAFGELGVEVEPRNLLLAGPTQLALGPAVEWWCDVTAFEQAASAGAAAEREGDLGQALRQWERAAELYRGPLLPGLPGHQPWVEERRQALESRYLELLRDLGAAYTRSGATAAAIDAYRRCLLLEPGQEAIHVALMRLYGRQDRRDLIRRQFQRLCGLLLDELGVEPLAETVAEYQRLMAGRE
jgi:DNA-binding SARP family transcriptional activator